MTILLYEADAVSKTYQGLLQGEYLEVPNPLPDKCIEVATLDGWTMVQPPPVPSPALVYQGYKAWFATHITAEQRILFSTPDGVIRRGFDDWQTEATPYSKVKMIELLEALKQIPGMEPFHPDIDRLIENCKLVME